MVAGNYRFFSGERFVLHDNVTGKTNAESVKASLKKKGYRVRLVSPGMRVVIRNGKAMKTGKAAYLIYKRK